MYKKVANSLRRGDILVRDGSFYEVVSVEHVPISKRKAGVQVQARPLKGSDSKGSCKYRYGSDEDVEVVDVMERKGSFLYHDEKNSEVVIIMDEDYDQVNISAEYVGDILPWMQDGTQLTVYFHDQSPLLVKLPLSVEARVESTESVLKHQKATASYKPAILENGFRVMVPPFIKNGDAIVVSTKDFTYVNRVKE